VRTRFAIDGAAGLALDLLLWVAGEQRQWALARLPTKEARKLTELAPSVHINVEGQPDRASFLVSCFGSRVKTAEVRPSGEVTVLRLTP